MSAANTDRGQTAVATLTLVERLHEVEADEIVEVLATADVATSELAMGECWSKMSELHQLLETTSWEIFEAVTLLTDERKTAADEVTNRILQALISDEYVTPLASALKVT